MDRIVLLEDDPALGCGVSLALTQPDRTVEIAATLREGRSLLERPCALLVLDLNLPDGNGLDLLAKLRRTGDRTPVLILTANDLEADQVAGLELGADDYVVKPFSLAVLRARVNALLRRGKAGGALELPPFSFDFDGMVFRRNGVPVELSKTEQRLLRLLVEHRGQTLTREQLLDRVWDSGEFVDENALSVAVRRLRTKLTDAPIRTVYGVGYVWEVRQL